MKFTEQPFMIGVNYWASHAGIRMWNDWRPDVVEDDIKRLQAHKVKYLRVFPLWSEFQPLTPLLDCRGKWIEYGHGDAFLEDTEEGRAGVDLTYIRRFEELCCIAKKYGMQLIVPLFTGWMSGRCFFPPAFVSKNVLTDPACMRWEIRFIRYFVKHFKDEDAIIAWEFGNESNCMGAATTDEAYAWSSALYDAIKSVDGDRPVISGMHSLSAGTEGWTIGDQAENSDVLTVHPYVLFTPCCDLDKLVSPRAILHVSAENCLYADLAKKPCLVEEIGSLGNVIGSEEQVAKFVRASLFTSLIHDGTGFYWWCAFDQEHLRYAPYDWADLERELGAFHSDKSAKPMAEELKKFDAFLHTLPCEKLPTRKKHAVCLVSSAAWEPAFGAFMTAKRAGFELQFERKDEISADSKLYILPGQCTLNFMRKKGLDVLMDKVRKGATLLITYNGSIVNPIEPLLGCVSEGRRASSVCKFRYMETDYAVPRNYTMDLQPTTARVLVYDEAGKPVITQNKLGEGNVLFFNFPLEMCVATTPNAERMQMEKLYALAAGIADIDNSIARTNPAIEITEHALEGGKQTLVFAVNNHDEEQTDSLILQSYTFEKSIYGDAEVCGDRVSIKVPPADAVVLLVNKK